MTTSHRISVAFTGLATILLAFFALLVNTFFFVSRYQQESRSLQETERLVPPHPDRQPARLRLAERFTKTIVLPASDPKALLLQKNTTWKNIAYEEGERFIRKSHGESVHIKHITPFIQRQKKLLQLSVFILLGGGVLSFLLSKRFVKYSLRDLKTVSDHVSQLHIDQLDNTIDLPHLPEHDEIRVVADSLNAAGKKIQEQVEQIKRFVDHAAHELKTPLMALQSTIDLGLKRRTYEDALKNTNTLLDQLNHIFDALVLLQSQTDTRGLQHDTIDLREISEKLFQQELEYTHKQLSIVFSPKGTGVIHTHKGGLLHILGNLISNAVKYSPEGSSVRITYSDAFWSISDEGDGIHPSELDHIREPFWQADRSKGKDQGVGLGLSVVKKYCDLLGYRCDVSSTPQVGSTFTIYFG